MFGRKRRENGADRKRPADTGPPVHRTPSSQEVTYGVVADVARRGSQMNDRSGRGTACGVSVHVRHDVVPGELLLVGGRHEVHVVDIGAEFVQLFLRYVQAQFLKTRNN